MLIRNVREVLRAESSLRGSLLIAWLLWVLFSVIRWDVGLFNSTIFLSIALFGPLVLLCLWMISYLENQQILRAQRGITD